MRRYHVAQLVEALVEQCHKDSALRTYAGIPAAAIEAGPMDPATLDAHLDAVIAPLPAAPKPPRAGSKRAVPGPSRGGRRGGARRRTPRKSEA
ncbi:hypothetical protein EON66_09120, partial [archaeon]